MKQEYVDEVSVWITNYFESESVGNKGEDIANISDFLDSRFGYLFDIMEEKNV